MFSRKKALFESGQLKSDDENSLGSDYPLPIDNDIDYSHDYILLPFGCGIWSKWQLKRFLIGIGIVAIFFACFGSILRYILSMDLDKKRMSDAVSGTGNTPNSYLIVDQEHKKDLRVETSQGASQNGFLKSQQLPTNKNEFSSIWT